jgi:hypothetical protein
MTDLDRARQLAHEISDRVYSVQRVGRTPMGYDRFVVILNVPDGDRFYIGVDSTNSWEERFVEIPGILKETK